MAVAGNTLVGAVAAMAVATTVSTTVGMIILGMLVETGGIEN